MIKKDFLELLDRYLAGNATPAEEELLYKVYQSFQKDNNWDLTDLKAIDDFENRLFMKLNYSINQSDEKEITEDQSKKRNFFSVQKLMIAASVIILITFGANYFLKKRTTNLVVANKNPILKNDFKAGGNNAYLILSNGKTVHLNQAKIGLLARQGNNSVIKQNDGQISYHQNNTSNVLNDSVLFNKIIVPVGGQYKVTLPDGTKVWINSSSSLEYPVRFTGTERKINLSGEAYFEVAKNKDMPFVVNACNKMNVKVLGTHFNVMAYDDENKVSATLLEGSVKVEDAFNLANKAVLIPGQQADLFSSQGKIKITKADLEEVTAWKDGRFLFNNESIYSIMRKLSRWYDVDVVFSKEMKGKSFDGSISKEKNISAVLKLMELTKSVHFKFEGRRVFVMP